MRPTLRPFMKTESPLTGAANPCSKRMWISRYFAKSDSDPPASHRSPSRTVMARITTIPALSSACFVYMVAPPGP